MILHKIWKFCTKFGRLVLMNIIQFVATRCHVLRLKWTKSNFGWGSAPDLAGEAYSAPPDSLAVLKGPTFKGEEVEGDNGGEKEEGRESEETPKGWFTPPYSKF